MSSLQEDPTEKDQLCLHDGKKSWPMARNHSPSAPASRRKEGARFGVSVSRDYQMISDSDTDFAGYNLGPNLLTKPQQIGGTLVHISTNKAAASNPPANGETCLRCSNKAFV